MIVMKFGGSSVKDAEMFRKVASIVKRELHRKQIVVLSACQGITDLLFMGFEESLKGDLSAYSEIEKLHMRILEGLGLDSALLAKELSELKAVLTANAALKEKGNRIKDYLAFFGERMSTKILAELLCTEGIKSEAFESGNIGLITDSNYTNAKILDNSYQSMKNKVTEIVQKGTVPVITGFGGKDLNGEYTTFQRGGSDYVAALFGAALDCEEIQIWTDVSGIFSADPRIVKNAKHIPEMSFDEASELAYFGAKVLHPKTIQPAVEKDIPVIVLNTFQPEHSGTQIVKSCHEGKGIVKAITYKKRITVIEIKSTRMLDAYGYLGKAFAVFEKYKKPVDMIATSEVKVSLTVDSEQDLGQIAKELEEIADVKIMKGKAIVYAVGEGVRSSSTMASQIFGILEVAGIKAHMASMCYDSISMGLVVDESEATKAVQLLHTELVEKQKT